VAAGQWQENISATVTALGTLADTSVIDPTSTTASMIALLKGLLDINQDGIIVIPSAVYTSTQTSALQTNLRGRGVVLYIKTGTFGATASAITVTILGKDPVSGSTYTILQSASLSASSFVVLRVYPFLTASANLIVNDVLPATWLVTAQATGWGTGGSTLGVACSLIE
jgi:hypothetical protein